MTTIPSHWRCWAEIRHSALHHNLGVAQQLSGTPSMAIVKANAYGHDIKLIAPVIADQIEMFGVANLDEALELQSLGLQKPIFLLGSCLDAELEYALQHQFHISASSLLQAQTIQNIAQKLGIQAQVHAVLDTGMGRIGFLSPHWNPTTWQQLQSFSNIDWQGITTHLPVPDEDAAYTLDQIRRFKACCDLATLQGFNTPWRHLANSAGILNFSQASNFCNLHRIGLMLYGSSPISDKQALLQPVLTWKTRITLIRQLPARSTVSYGRTVTLDRPTLVATLACGYADGYPRQASNRGAHVLVQGQRCPILGRVTMDQIMVDVTDLATPPHSGDEVVLIGQQEQNIIHAAELATCAQTIAWHIYTSLGTRVRRISA